MAVKRGIIRVRPASKSEAHANESLLHSLENEPFKTLMICIRAVPGTRHDQHIDRIGDLWVVLQISFSMPGNELLSERLLSYTM